MREEEDAHGRHVEEDADKLIRRSDAQDLNQRNYVYNTVAWSRERDLAEAHRTLSELRAEVMARTCKSHRLTETSDFPMQLLYVCLAFLHVHVCVQFVCICSVLIQTYTHTVRCTLVQVHTHMFTRTYGGNIVYTSPNAFDLATHLKVSTCITNIYDPVCGLPLGPCTCADAPR